MSATVDDAEFNIAGSSLLLKLFYALAALVLLSIALSFAGKWFGASIVMAGHTDNSSLREIVIGDNVISAPANSIRFERQRVNGVAERLDLYFRYPDMTGYTPEASADFNNSGETKNIIFMSFEPRMMSRDMSGRFEPIYSSLVVEPPSDGPAGLAVYTFNEKSGYLNETLVVGFEGEEPYVARCLSGQTAQQSLAPCERDIQLGDELSMTYRFPKELLPDWENLDLLVREKAQQMLTR